MENNFYEDIQLVLHNIKTDVCVSEIHFSKLVTGRGIAGMVMKTDLNETCIHK